MTHEVGLLQKLTVEALNVGLSEKWIGLDFGHQSRRKIKSSQHDLDFEIHDLPAKISFVVDPPDELIIKLAVGRIPDHWDMVPDLVSDLPRRPRKNETADILWASLWVRRMLCNEAFNFIPSISLLKTSNKMRRIFDDFDPSPGGYILDVH